MEGKKIEELGANFLESKQLSRRIKGGESTSLKVRNFLGRAHVLCYFLTLSWFIFGAGAESDVITRPRFDCNFRNNLSVGFD